MGAADFQRETEQWRADRLARLKAEDGWLTLVGLFWITDGDSRVGSDSSAEVPLPASLPKQVGSITLRKGKAHFKPAAGIAIKETDLQPDSVAGHEVVSLGSVRFYLIERGGRFGIRVKDSNSEARVNFTGINQFPIDESWRIEGTFTPSPHKVVFDTEVGIKQDGDSPGYVDFERDGQRYRLEPVLEDNELSFVIRDATSGKTTYAASRFVDAELPKGGLVAGSKVVLDFNKAYNPPCVFTDYATCPLPTPQNRLRLAITAGEQMYKR
ncbi:MAG: DUF1684 domain-containing protein [Acidobacteriota bacterium]